MTRRYMEIAFGPEVVAAQEQYGNRETAERMAASRVDDRRLGESEKAFIAERDGFYLASVGADGWPYIQFRGGPIGFLKVLDDRTLAYADFRGNRQMVSTGNMNGDGRVSLFFMDYAHRRRLKMFARACVIPADEAPEEFAGLIDPDYRAVVERFVVFRLEAFDWNCPQHITPRWTAAEQKRGTQTY